MRSRIAFVSIALIALAWSSGSKPTGTWLLDLIVLNGDTIFLASDSSYSLRYNLKTSGQDLLSREDSSTAISASLERFHINRGTFIQLGDDDAVRMTKVRSGGRVYPNEVDSGHYEMRHDTVVFTIRTRRDHQFALVHDAKREVLHLTDGPPNHMVHQEYRKERSSVSPMSSMPDLDVILAGDDVNSMIIAIDTYISDLCQYGERLDRLTEPQLYFYLNQCFERELNNGGFDQYFRNAAGAHAAGTLHSLKAIGAEKTMSLLQAAMDLFPGGKVPQDHDERLEVVGAIEDQVEHQWEGLESEFFAYEDDLNKLNLAFIIAHRDSF